MRGSADCGRGGAVVSAWGLRGVELCCILASHRSHPATLGDADGLPIQLLLTVIAFLYHCLAVFFSTARENEGRHLQTSRERVSYDGNTEGEGGCGGEREDEDVQRRRDRVAIKTFGNARGEYGQAFGAAATTAPKTAQAMTRRNGRHISSLNLPEQLREVEETRGCLG